MPESRPPEPRTLSYATTPPEATPGLRRACAAAMAAGGMAELCGVVHFVLVMFPQLQELLRPQAPAVGTYLQLVLGFVLAAVVAAGLALWRRGDRSTLRWARRASSAWLFVTIAVWANGRWVDLRYHDVPDHWGEVPPYAIHVAGEALPIVLPALLWWLVRHAGATDDGPPSASP